MGNFCNYNDFELLELVKSGHSKAFDEIYYRYWPVMYRLASRMLGDGELSNDAIQDVFVSFWERRDRIRSDISLKHYLYAATRNQVLMHIRSSQIASRYLETLGDELQTSAFAADESLLISELEARFEAELQYLPPRMREAFEMSRIADNSYKEIAKKMEISENTVKHHISGALRILRKKLTVFVFFLLLISYL